MSKIIDISECEKEPVRFIGAIQPFGAMIRLDQKSEVTHYSENLKEITGIDGEFILGKKFDLNVIDTKKFSVSVLHEGQHQLLEIENLKDEKPFNINPFLDKLQGKNNLHSLLQSASEALSQISGLDRVMVYKFHYDGHGEVVAETTSDVLESFLGLHYPASDIPPQARSIFLENWVRMIPDISYKAVPLKGYASTTTLDLGKSLLRAVSPIHIDYLKNMNVGASLSISIIVEGKLWGLFACHHASDKYLSKVVRDNCETIGRITSALIRETYLKEVSFHAGKLKVIHDKLMAKMGRTDALSQELTESSPSLVDIIKSEGAAAALYIDGFWATIGNVPDKNQLDELVKWIAVQHPGDVFHTHELSTLFPTAEAYKHVASGLLAAAIPKTKQTYILWFRPEIIQVMKWAGNPDKVVEAVNGRLTPRASFEEYKQSVKGKSIPWEVWEVDAAVELRNAVMAVDLRRQFEKEQKARAEAERAQQAREDLMAMVSHDLKNPLSSIMMNAQLIKRFLLPTDAKSKEVAERIHKSAITMNNLIDDILSVTKLEAGHMSLEVKNLPLHSVIDETVEILSPMAAVKNIKLERHRQSFECSLHFDEGRMLQVFSNIIGNAIKFTPDGGSIIVNIEKCSVELVRISIKDTGPGIPKDHLPNVFDRFWQANQTKRLGTGLGLAIVKGIVEKHGGEIWAESELGNGTTFIIELPGRF